MVNSLYDIIDVEAKLAPPLTVRNHIRDVLLAEKGQCYRDMERYLIPPGVSGSRQFDQSDAVNVLLAHDLERNGAIASAMEQTPGLNKRTLWDLLYSVLRTIGFKMRHGRLTGLLEHKQDEKNENGDAGQPDID